MANMSSSNKTGSGKEHQPLPDPWKPATEPSAPPPLTPPSEDTTTPESPDGPINRPLD